MRVLTYCWAFTPSQPRASANLPMLALNRVCNTSDLPCREYIRAMRGVRSRLLARSAGGLLYVAELVDGTLVPKMDHLVCFLPGVLALGHLHGLNTGETGAPPVTGI